MKKNIKKTPLYDLRQKKGLTQKDVADAIGTTANQISRLENGERKLAPEWLERLSKVLNCTKAELLGEEPTETISERERAFLEMFRNLSEREQNSIMAAFNVLAQSKPDVKTGNDK